MIIWAPKRRDLNYAVFALCVLTAAVLFLAWRPGEVTERIEPAAAGLVPPSLRPIYSADTGGEKVVAITFDISWGTRMPPKVLDVLKAHGQQATFFLSGPWSRNHTDMVQRIVADGHDVQSHGQRHDNFSGLGSRGVTDNIQAADAILRELTGERPRFIRPPNGDFNATSLEATRAAGYQTVMWSVDSLDWKNPGVQAITRRVLNLTKPGDIILLHASDSCRQTDQALPQILAGLKARGFHIVTVSELLQKYPVNPAGYIRTPQRP